MKHKVLIFVIFVSILMNGHSQNYSTLSGTIRFSGGVMGGMMLIGPMMGFGMMGANLPGGYSEDLPGWIRNNHISFLRFVNAGYDYLIPQWSITFSNDAITLDQTSSSNDNTFHELFFTNRCYINYIGYYINWKDMFSRYGLYFGADYELRKFSLEYKSNIPNHYNYWHTHNEIQSLVPSVGLRYRLISPEKEIDGFPFNVVVEAGLSYAIVVNYKNDVYSTDDWNNYSIDALNNGFRTSIGIAITTNKWGSLYVRWVKDLYNLYNNDYIATDVNGYLYNNDIKTSTSYISIGWATFL